MTQFKRFVGLTLLLATGACSAWPEGLVGVGATQDCRAVVSDSAAEQTWLLVHFRRPPIMVFRVVPAIGDHEYGLGDPVLVNVSDRRVPAHVSPVSSKVDLI